MAEFDETPVPHEPVQSALPLRAGLRTEDAPLIPARMLNEDFPPQNAAASLKHRSRLSALGGSDLIFCRSYSSVSRLENGS